MSLEYSFARPKILTEPGKWLSAKRSSPKKPDNYLLKDGMYECKTCKPEIKVKADGQMQPVTGERYFDMLMIKVVDDKAVEWAPTKGGKDPVKSKMRVSSPR